MLLNLLPIKHHPKLQISSFYSKHSKLSPTLCDSSMARVIPTSANKKLSTAANLANLLPTGTILAFQALMPSFTNNGSCLPAHKYLTSAALMCFSFVCLILSFTDSFIASNGKLYYGIATFKGLYVFNKDDDDDNNVTTPIINMENNQAQRNVQGEISHDEERGEIQKKPQSTTKDDNEDEEKKIFSRYRIRVIDFVHAICAWMVFVVYAMCSSDVQRCLYPNASDNGHALMKNLPLAVGAAVSFLFMLFPTKRRGIGYADIGTQKK